MRNKKNNMRKIYSSNSLQQRCQNAQFIDSEQPCEGELDLSANVMMEPFRTVKHVVVDSGPFIKNASIQVNR